MPNFTPGPWKANDNGHFIEVNADPIDKDRPLDMYSPAVAFVWNVGDNTAQANAHLIAAAPAMYDALHRAVTEMEFYAKGHADAEIAIARAALAQAEGKL